MSQDLDTYLSTPITGGAAITPIQMITALDGVSIAEPNTNDPPQMVFKLDNSDVEALHALNLKYEGIMSFSYDGTEFYGINVGTITPILMKALVDLNTLHGALRTEFDAYVLAHP